MTKTMLALGVAAAALALNACDKADQPNAAPSGETKDSAGAKATVSKADDKYSNGVVHHIDTVLVPAQQGER